MDKFFDGLDASRHYISDIFLALTNVAPIVRGSEISDQDNGKELVDATKHYITETVNAITYVDDFVEVACDGNEEIINAINESTDCINCIINAAFGMQ